MKTEIRHRRLYAFFHSKVLNTLTIFLSVMITLLKSVGMSIPVLSSIGIAFLLMIGYSCWLWFWKPITVTINEWLSNMSSYFAIFMLAAVAVKSDNFMWSTFPMVAGVITMFIAAVKNSDEQFEIPQ